MNEGVKGSISNFFGWFEYKWQFLSSLPDLLVKANITDERARHVVKDLRLLRALVDLEVLGRVANPCVHSSKERFVKVLMGYSGQAEWALVSVPEMWYQIRQRGRQTRGRLEDGLRKVGARPEWQNPNQTLCNLVAPSHVADMGAEAAAASLDKPLDQTAQALRAAGVCIDAEVEALMREFTHAAILYRDYRCGLAHEGRRRSHGWDIEGSPRQCPYYFSVTDVDTSGMQESDACLVIPDVFTLAALGKCIEGVRRLCEAHGFDPYERAAFE
jgi:hypothetical protein